MLFDLCFIFKVTETVSVMTPTAKSAKTEASATESISLVEKIRSLIVKAIKVRQKAGKAGNKRYISALTSYIKSLAKLTKVVKGRQFDKEKVGNILTALGQRIDRINEELEVKVTTRPGLATSMTVATETFSTKMPDTVRKLLTQKTKSLIMEVAQVRKKAASFGQSKYVPVLNAYIRTLAKVLQILKGSKFDQANVERILGGLRKRTERISAELEERVTKVTSTEPKETEILTTVPIGKVCPKRNIHASYT